MHGDLAAHQPPQWTTLRDLINHPYVIKRVNVLCIMYINMLKMYYILVIYEKIKKVKLFSFMSKEE